MSEAFGRTVVVYFPPEADHELVDRFTGKVHVLADDFFPNRGDWDPFVFAQRGDICHVENDDHVYLSTACLHKDHKYCQSGIGQSGQKTPKVCKFCSAPCICDCHKENEGNTVDGQ